MGRRSSLHNRRLQTRSAGLSTVASLRCVVHRVLNQNKVGRLRDVEVDAQRHVGRGSARHSAIVEPEPRRLEGVVHPVLQVLGEMKPCSVALPRRDAAADGRQREILACAARRGWQASATLPASWKSYIEMLNGSFAPCSSLWTAVRRRAPLPRWATPWRLCCGERMNSYVWLRF